MGTPEFALPSLQALLESPYAIAGVITQPDRPKGRGRQLVFPPVKVLAEAHGLPVWQPEKVRDPAFIRLFQDMVPDLVVVAAFGQILPKEIIDAPALGCINVHPSLLPRHRGAAPINWTLITGDAITGVTIMLMDEGIDSGDILLQKETPVDPYETHDMLRDRLAIMGAELLLEAIHQTHDGTITRTPQDPARASIAPRLTKETGRIRWEGDAASIVNLIRGLSSIPGAYTHLEGKVLKIFSASYREMPVSEKPGTVIGESAEGLGVAAGDGYVFIKDVQIENKRRMPVHAFLKGFRMRPNLVLTP
jgi:methionyl-tRNA formyltransferase